MLAYCLILSIKHSQHFATVLSCSQKCSKAYDMNQMGFG